MAEQEKGRNRDEVARLVEIGWIDKNGQLVKDPVHFPVEYLPLEVPALVLFSFDLMFKNDHGFRDDRIPTEVFHTIGKGSQAMVMWGFDSKCYHQTHLDQLSIKGMECLEMWLWRGRWANIELNIFRYTVRLYDLWMRVSTRRSKSKRKHRFSLGLIFKKQKSQIRWCSPSC